MKDKIEVAGSVDEILGILVNGGGEMQQRVDVDALKDEILMAQLNTFLNMLPRFLELDKEEFQDFMGALSAWKNIDNDQNLRQKAFFTLAEYMYGPANGGGGAAEPVHNNEKQIMRMDKSTVQCEDCESTETHKVKFTKGNREETHFLCEKCEASARRE